MDNRPRIKTKYPGVAYRERSDGRRQHMIWYKGTDGKARWQNTPGGLKDAVQARAKVIDQIHQGHKVAPSKMLFADFAREWLEEQGNLAPKSVASYRNSIENHLIPRLGRYTKLSDVDVNHVAAMVALMRKDGLKAWTIRTVLTPLSRIMATAARRGMAPANPVPLLERSERPVGDAAKMNILDTDEINLLLARSGNWAPVFTTLIFTGLRISELLALRWEDVNWNEGLIHVAGTKTKAASRDVVLPEFLRQMLAARSLESTSEFVFKGNRNSAGRALGRCLAKAGVTKHVRLHDLRHTHASILIHQGHPDSFIAEQMGHSSAAFTRSVYGHMFDGKKQRETARERLQAEFGEVLS